MTYSASQPGPGRPRQARLIVALIVLAALSGWLLTRADRLRALPPPVDFVEYWAAGRLNATGGNPYDPGQLFALQKQTGSEHVTEHAIVMWNPPWTLALVMPLGLLPGGVAVWVWALVQAAALFAGADMLWRVYGGPAAQRWVAWLLALAFVPSLMVLSDGQIGGLFFLGVAGFLFFQQRGQPFRAGLLAALAGIKPHLFGLFWAALLLDSLYRRDGRAILGGLLAGALASLAALLPNPDVFRQYYQLLTAPLSPELLRPLASFPNPTPGYWLRRLLGSEHIWPQFVILPLGLAWLAATWWRNRHDWDWPRQLPLLLLVSFLAAPYGAWRFDMVIFLVPLIQLALHWSRRLSGRGLALAAVVYAATQVWWVVSVRALPFWDNKTWCVWAPLALLGVYLVSGVRTAPAGDD